jgi:NAD(P)-dependent dehydrogenase (short-subunit alcohol dehydrogenase family)
LAPDEQTDSFGASVNILQLYPKSDYFTGAAIQLLALAKGLAARGHHVVVATRPGEGWVDRCAEAGLPYHAVPMRSEADVRSVPELVRILRRHHVQVVHCHKGKARTLALMAGLVVILPGGAQFPAR